jgi:hypothetical protein
MIGRLYSFIFITYHKRFLGFRRSTYLQILILYLAGWAWWQQQPWSNPLAIVFLVVFLLVGVAYRWVRRKGYTQFSADPKWQEPAFSAPTLPIDKHYDIRTTGIFGVAEREEYTLLRPANMWYMSRGELALMVRQPQKKFLYEFVNPQLIESIRGGTLLFGKNPLPTLAIKFGSTWGPKFADHDRTMIAGTPLEVEPIGKTIYLTVEDESLLPLMWRSLLNN